MRPTGFEPATFGLKGGGSSAWGAGSRRRCDQDETPIGRRDVKPQALGATTAV